MRGGFDLLYDVILEDRAREDLPCRELWVVFMRSAFLELPKYGTMLYTNVEQFFRHSADHTYRK